MYKCEFILGTFVVSCPPTKNNRSSSAFSGLRSTNPQIQNAANLLATDFFLLTVSNGGVSGFLNAFSWSWCLHNFRHNIKGPFTKNTPHSMIHHFLLFPENSICFYKPAQTKFGQSLNFGPKSVKNWSNTGQKTVPKNCPKNFKR